MNKSQYCYRKTYDTLVEKHENRLRLQQINITLIKGWDFRYILIFKASIRLLDIIR